MLFHSPDLFCYTLPTMRRLNQLLLLVFLFSCFLHVTVSVTWACEGRICSRSATCCCRSNSSCDSHCSPRHRGETASYEGKCDCVPHIQGDSRCLAVVRTSTSIPQPPNAFPALRVFFFPPISETETVRGVEIRGPPAKSLPLLTPVLRGPPTPWFSSLV
jgi:hypothetical protein